MTRYALIDLESGYVWHVCDAETPEAACTLATAETGGMAGVRYVPTTRAGAGNYSSSGYSVHIAPAGYDCRDGRDRDTIRQVWEMPSAGAFRAAS